MTTAREKALHEALRDVAIVFMPAPDQVSRSFCKVCECHWRDDEEEAHAPACLARPDALATAVEDERDARQRFEQWYVEHAFDFEKSPIGSRDCALQWNAWQAALSYDAGVLDGRREWEAKYLASQAEVERLRGELKDMTADRDHEYQFGEGMCRQFEAADERAETARREGWEQAREQAKMIAWRDYQYAETEPAEPVQAGAARSIYEAIRSLEYDTTPRAGYVAPPTAAQGAAEGK